LALLKALMRPFSEMTPPEPTPSPAEISMASPPLLLGGSPPTTKLSATPSLFWLKNAEFA